MVEVNIDADIILRVGQREKIYFHYENCHKRVNLLVLFLYPSSCVSSIIDFTHAHLIADPSPLNQFGPLPAYFRSIWSPQKRVDFNIYATDDKNAHFVIVYFDTLTFPDHIKFFVFLLIELFCPLHCLVPSAL